MLTVLTFRYPSGREPALIPAFGAWLSGWPGIGRIAVDAVWTARAGGRGAEVAGSHWGDWGQACVMAFEYRDPRTGELVTVEQAVRVQRPTEWRARRGPAEILCWGVLRSGLLRHPLFIGWTSTAG